MLNRGPVEEFARRGFLVLPRVVPPEVVAAAARAIDELIEREPPGAGGPDAGNLWVWPGTHLTHAPINVGPNLDRP